MHRRRRNLQDRCASWGMIWEELREKDVCRVLQASGEMWLRSKR